MTIALYAEFTASAGNAAAVSSLIDEFATVVRTEPGNLRFDPHRLASDPHSVFVYELYRDQLAFDTHLASAHGLEFNRKLTSLITGGQSQLTMLDPIGVFPA
ncbi:putative quinol monooxygenase [Subtercola frigoramans]|uniref:Quinol monooxygenase YgiN n=1 Tax=Subtercola frigoramans TaxID=120298 RepID=A0ABS2L1Z5_9MICO|nr:putative quinol monooxygenase [Subtercola frigoramans]MBM7471097.1 quinol monooxygenase YgiN [Subtercola frigoramans]